MRTAGFSRLNLASPEVRLRPLTYLLKADKKAIFTAASQAQKAADCITDAIGVTEAVSDLAEAA